MMLYKVALCPSYSMNHQLYIRFTWIRLISNTVTIICMNCDYLPPCFFFFCGVSSSCLLPQACPSPLPLPPHLPLIHTLEESCTLRMWPANMALFQLLCLALRKHCFIANYMEEKTKKKMVFIVSLTQTVLCIDFSGSNHAALCQGRPLVSLPWTQYSCCREQLCALIRQGGKNGG